MKLRPGLVQCEDDIIRCFWSADHSAHFDYHDNEWGHPTTSDNKLFEKITLEGFQSGLSWLTILLKRERFRKVFYNFNIQKVAAMTSKDEARLLQDAGIVRHRGKIAATIENAKQTIQVQKEFTSLHAYFSQFIPPEEERPKKLTYEALKKLNQTMTSKALSKDLKKRGFKFVGPTTCYAFLQSAGFVNDHIDGCPAGDHLRNLNP
jgi:DNA-3-methyladenine glycosylase I